MVGRQPGIGRRDPDRLWKSVLRRREPERFFCCPFFPPFLLISSISPTPPVSTPKPKNQNPRPHLPTRQSYLANSKTPLPPKTDWLTQPPNLRGTLPPSGFCGLSTRTGVKPVLAAVNGLAVGGAVEALLNCDMVVAARHATLALPDLKVGLTLLGSCARRGGGARRT